MLELVSIGGAEPAGGIQLASFLFNLVFHLFSKCWRAVTGGYLGSGPASGENITCFSRCGQQSPTSPPDHPDEQRRRLTAELTVVETPVLEPPLGDELPGTWSWDLMMMMIMVMMMMMMMMVMMMMMMCYHSPPRSKILQQVSDVDKNRASDRIRREPVASDRFRLEST